MLVRIDKCTRTSLQVQLRETFSPVWVDEPAMGWQMMRRGGNHVKTRGLNLGAARRADFVGQNQQVLRIRKRLPNYFSRFIRSCRAQQRYSRRIQSRFERLQSQIVNPAAANTVKIAHDQPLFIIATLMSH